MITNSFADTKSSDLVSLVVTTFAKLDSAVVIASVFAVRLSSAVVISVILVANKVSYLVTFAVASSKSS